MASRHITEVPPPGAAAVLAELRGGGQIGAIAKRMGLHHQTLKRLLIEHDAAGFAATQNKPPRPRRPRPQAPATPPPPSAASAQETLVDQVRKEIRAGWNLRQCARKRQLPLKKLIAQLPPELVEDADPGGTEKRQKLAKREDCKEAIRLLQMDVEPDKILERLPGLSAADLKSLSQLCEEDVLGSRWALKRIGPFTCEGTSDWIPNRSSPMRGVWMRCACGHRQLRSPIGLSLGLTSCDACGRRC